MSWFWRKFSDGREAGHLDEKGYPQDGGYPEHYDGIEAGVGEGKPKPMRRRRPWFGGRSKEMTPEKVSQTSRMGGEPVHIKCPRAEHRVSEPPTQDEELADTLVRELNEANPSLALQGFLLATAGATIMAPGNVLAKLVAEKQYVAVKADSKAAGLVELTIVVTLKAFGMIAFWGTIPAMVARHYQRYALAECLDLPLRIGKEAAVWGVEWLLESGGMI